ncbi:MAG: DUF6884 domain-containing protein [Stellaceae bacterium]
MIVGLVGCCAEKLTRPAPAREIYRSPLFRKASAWAESHCDAWAILSALRGVVLPDQVIQPYEARLPRGEAYRRWQLGAHGQLHVHFEGATRFVFLAGADYACDVAVNCPWHEGGPEDECHLPFQFPLLGKGIGARLQFLGRSLS